MQKMGRVAEKRPKALTFIRQKGEISRGDLAAELSNQLIDKL